MTPSPVETASVTVSPRRSAPTGLISSTVPCGLCASRSSSRTARPRPSSSVRTSLTGRPLYASGSTCTDDSSCEVAGAEPPTPRPPVSSGHSSAPSRANTTSPSSAHSGQGLARRRRAGAEPPPAGGPGSTTSPGRVGWSRTAAISWSRVLALAAAPAAPAAPTAAAPAAPGPRASSSVRGWAAVTGSAAVAGEPSARVPSARGWVVRMPS